MNKIYAVILAGGKGTRLWPLSSDGYSKSFVKIAGRGSMVENAIKRLEGFIERGNVLLVVDKKQYGLTKQALKTLPAKNIIVEPFGRNTASAVGLAAINVPEDVVLVVLPTDTHISNEKAYRKTLKAAAKFISRTDGNMACIGIKPTGISTGYGYIKKGYRYIGKIYKAARFTEKPNYKTAKKFTRSGAYLWNAGIFIFKAKDILSTYRKYSPKLYSLLMKIKLKKMRAGTAYKKMDNISIDSQVMEKACNLYCVEAGFKWKDIGNWDTMEALFEKDKKGNVSVGENKFIGSANTFVYNTSNKICGVLGVSDIAVISTQNGTLVLNKKLAEKVKDLNII